MITIAILAKKKSLFDLLITNYNRLPIHFYWFEQVEQFIRQKEFEEWKVIWVIDTEMEWVQDALAVINEKEIDIPVVCSTSNPKQDERQLFWQLKVKEIIPWPIHRLELEYILKSYEKLFTSPKEEKEYAFQGALEYINGVELFRAFNKATCSGVLHLHWAERKGRIELKNGQIVHAVYRQMDPLTSVLVMSSWNHGFVFFKPDQFVSKRSIMLSNEQIFEECADYLKERNHLLSSFGNLQTPYYPYPDLNYEEFGPTERQILRQMRKGKTIEEIIDTYEGDVSFLLKKLKTWIAKEYILPETQYQKIKEQIEEEENAPALKRIVKKLFAKKEIEPMEVVEENKRQAVWQTALEQHFPHTNVLSEIKKRLEELP